MNFMMTGSIPLEESYIFVKYLPTEIQIYLLVIRKERYMRYLGSLRVPLCKSWLQYITMYACGDGAFGRLPDDDNRVHCVIDDDYLPDCCRVSGF